MASSKSLQQAIANIKIWHKGEQRAPHKPLLLLYVLAGYLHGHPRLFDYGSKSTNLCTVYWNVLGHSVHSTDLICRSGDYKATDSGNYTMPSVAQQQGAADNRQ